MYYLLLNLKTVIFIQNVARLENEWYAKTLLQTLKWMTSCHVTVSKKWRFEFLWSKVIVGLSKMMICACHDGQEFDKIWKCNFTNLDEKGKCFDKLNKNFKKYLTDFYLHVPNCLTSCSHNWFLYIIFPDFFSPHICFCEFQKIGVGWWSDVF